jgi:monofunctional glycosyltransferase
MASDASALRPAGSTAAVAFLCLLAVAGLFWFTLPSAEPLRNGNPATTALIQARAQEAREHGRPARHNQHWVPLSQISPWLQRAVINSEDARFFEHDGIDVEQTKIALTTAVEEGHFQRGASTITQQLAKNLWLGEERTLWRKLREAILARRLEKLGKHRVLELYLNVVEWGDGIYGADAAARVWFGKPAVELLPEESAILAAMLPAPLKRNPLRPSKALRKRAHEVLRLYWMYQEISDYEFAQARWRLDALLSPS